MNRTLSFGLIALVIFVVGAEFLFLNSAGTTISASTPTGELSTAALAVATTTPSIVATSSTKTVQKTSTTSLAVAKKPSNEAVSETSTTTGDEVERIQNPYPTPAESFSTVNASARNAVVNILCEPQGGSSLNPISGSGVIIDPRGVILTNAHVAQYVLLSESPQVNLQCFIRTGSPATSQWTATVLYIPPVWVSDHYTEILEQHPTGTGEHDYALLYITGSVNGAPLPAQFPYLPFDTRPAIGFPGDDVLVASYPAELVGGIAAQYDLYADSSVTTIKQLLTFSSGTPDVMSLGGIIEAQSGSSGGAVINAWGYLVGLIATTSSGTTTEDRDLRAISLNYINSDLSVQSGKNLNDLLQGDLMQETASFTSDVAPGLINLYINELGSPEQE